MGPNRQQYHYEDPLSRLHKAHSTVAQVLTQIDELVLKAHKLGAHKQIDGLDLCSFSKLMETTASSFQEWIPRFKDATHEVCMVEQVCQDVDNPTSMQEDKGMDEDLSKCESLLYMQSENVRESLLDVDVLLADQNNELSNSPLVPWPDTMQFFLPTPMAKPKKAVSHVLLSRSSIKEQERLQTLLQERVLHTDAGIIPVDLLSSLETCAEVMQVVPDPATSSSKLSSSVPCLNEQESIREICPVSAASTPSHLVHRHSIEDPESIDIVTPVPPQSLVKRYSNFYEADDHFSDSSPMPLITPAVKQKQASPQGLTAKEEENIEITEYFTAFSPPRSLAPSIFKLKRSPYSLDSVNSSPQDKAGGAIQHVTNVVEHSTPLPPQSLMKRYPQILHTEEERDDMFGSTVALTPMFMSSPPKTCILMQTNRAENSVRSRKSLQTSLLPLKSPFRTPGLKSIKVINPFYEDMDLTSMKKPGQPPRHPESVRMTPWSDMQFATVKKAHGSVKRTPLVDLQVSTVRKPGAPLPGEQTLKRELWSRMETEFASMAHVCKSLFTDSQAENPKVEEAGVENRQPKAYPKVEEAGVERRQPKGKLAAPRAGIRLRGPSMY